MKVHMSSVPAHIKAAGAAAPDSFAALFEESLARQEMKQGEVITAEVVRVDQNHVVVNAGLKSEAYIPIEEFKNDLGGLDVKPGDFVSVAIESLENGHGDTILSRDKAKRLAAWLNLEKALDNGELVSGTITGKVKGGLTVMTNGIRAFLPGSLVDTRPVKDTTPYEGKTLEFKVIKLDRKRNNVVLSRRAVVEATMGEERAKLMETLKEGSIVKGVVKNITDFGAFIHLGGVDGLLYITDISWGRINHPSEVLQLNQKLNVVVLDFDDNKKRISLGLKQLTPHPWEVLDANIQVGSVVKGKIVNIEDYGAFLEIMPGVEGLIHVSEITWSNQPINSKEFFTLGNEYEAKVVTLDREERKMSLSLKQLSEDPWKSAKDKYPIGSRHSGLVKNITNYGVFVELDENIGGMVHISDLSWIKRLNHPSEFVKVGQHLDIVILDIDEDNRKMSLGHKQIEEDPWDTFEQVFPIGSVHEGTITRKDEKGALVSLPYGLEGYAPNKHLEKADGSMAHAEEVLPFKVIEFDRNDKRILVSHSRFVKETVDEEKREIKKDRQRDEKKTKTQLSKVQKNVEKTTLGELDVLSQLKEQMAKDSKDAKDAAKSAADEAEDAAETTEENTEE